MGFTCPGWPVRPALTQRPCSLGLAAPNKHGTLAQNPLPPLTPLSLCSFRRRRCRCVSSTGTLACRLPPAPPFPAPFCEWMGRSFRMGDEPMRARIRLRFLDRSVSSRLWDALDWCAWRVYVRLLVTMPALMLQSALRMELWRLVNSCSPLLFGWLL